MKHAYLIMAHNEFDLLKKLLMKLDYDNNDIYLHIDKKVKDFDFDEFSHLLHNAKIYFSDRVDAHWGGYTLALTEWKLLKQATRTYHDYYHLISGVDLPIKTHEQIDEYFEKNNGYEFVAFDKVACANNEFLPRIKYYHIQMPHNPYLRRVARFVNSVSLRVQKYILRIDRTKKVDLVFKVGSNWFDITHDFASYIVNQLTEHKEYVQAYKHSNCADEIFVQTFLTSSRFAEKIAKQEIRFIDWSKHGLSPETLTNDYWEQIVSSQCLFARKFSTKVDNEIINKIIEKF